MTRFKIANPGTVAGEFSRALMAKMWNADLENGPGVDAYRIDACDIEALVFHMGQADARSALRGADFHWMRPGYWITRWRTQKGGDNVQRLLLPCDLMHQILRTYGREDHDLSLVVSAGAKANFAPYHTP